MAEAQLAVVDGTTPRAKFINTMLCRASEHGDVQGPFWVPESFCYYYIYIDIYIIICFY